MRETAPAEVLPAHLRHLRSLQAVTCAAVSGVGLWQPTARLA